MRQWHREVELKRVRVSWRCEMCDVEEHKVFDLAPHEMYPEPFEHEWAFIDPDGFGDTKGPAVCGKTCAEAFATRLVERAYRAAVPA